MMAGWSGEVLLRKEPWLRDGGWVGKGSRGQRDQHVDRH